MKMNLEPTTRTMGMVERSQSLINGQADTELFHGNPRPELDQGRGHIDEVQRWDERPNERIIHQDL